MKRSFIKKTIVTALACFCTFSSAVSADELPVIIDNGNLSQTSEADTARDMSTSVELRYRLDADTAYELDLEGDGIPDRFSYQTYTQQTDNGFCSAILELYVNDQLICSLSDDTWSYCWKVQQCPLEGGSTLLLASSISDNDWTTQVLLLSKDAGSDTFTVLGDLTDLVKVSDEHPDNPLSAWARAGFVSAVSGNTVTVTWLDTMMSTGILCIPFVFDVTDGLITLKDDTWMLDAEKEWTDWIEFDVMDAPGSDTVLFRVSEGEKVFLTEFACIDGHQYLKCINQQGLEGWFEDPEDMVYETATDFTLSKNGYFEESLFAG